MNLEAEILEIKRTQARIDSKLTALLNKPKREVWVKVSFIKDLTGLSSEKLRQAREQGIIECRKTEENGIEYLLSSIPGQFLKRTA